MRALSRLLVLASLTLTSTPVAAQPILGTLVDEASIAHWTDDQARLHYDLAFHERRLEYRCTGLRISATAEHLGGRMEFERVPGGAWIVR